MKGCPVCGRLYPDDAGFCPVDGQALTSATQAPVAPDDQDSRLGQLIADRYELRRVVADGAMGRVYEALDRLDRCNVAVKILHDSVAGDTVAVERFRREFQVNSLVAHDYIVRVMDFLPTRDGGYALVTEFLYGEELSATLRRSGKLAPARVVRMLSQVALALDIAHAKKLVHRDLKPDNLFLCQTSDGDNVKILDFGSVKDKARGAKHLTVIGTTIGSPFYMAPEQAQGLPTLDHRADVWALAVICFECLTGRVPFSGPNGPSILANIIQQDAPAPSAVVAKGDWAIPPSVDAVFARALRKKPDHRPGSVGELADELGVAFGLRGTHAEWAAVPESRLRERMNAGVAATAASGAFPQPDLIEEGFFGVGQALGEGPTSDRPIVSSSVARSKPRSAGARRIPRASGGGVDSARMDLPVRKQWPLLLAGIISFVVALGLWFLL